MIGRDLVVARRWWRVINRMDRRWYGFEVEVALELALAGVGDGHRRQQRFGVRVLRVLEYRAAGADLDDTP